MLSERRSALLANQEKWKQRISGQQLTPEVAKMSSLEARKSALLQASGGWKERVKHDESVNSLSSSYRIKKDIFLTPKASSKAINELNENVREAPQSVPRQMKFAPSCGPSVAELTKKAIVFKPASADVDFVETAKLEIEEASPKVVSITRRPAMIKNRRLPSSLVALAVDTSTSSSGAMKRSPDSDKENENCQERAAKECLSEDRKNKILLAAPKPLKISPPAEDRTPILGVKNCGIALRKPELKRPYPDLMLIRCKGSKMVDVRCVAPRTSSLHECATFVLITFRRLMIFEGEYSSVVERAKATQIAHSVISTRDLACAATKIELVKDDVKVERDFYHELRGAQSNSGDGPSEVVDKIPRELIKYIDPESDQVFEDAARQVNQVFDVSEGEPVLISSGEIPYAGLLDSSKILVFDFGSEIYTWIGHDADRSLVKLATDFAQDLKETAVDNSSLLFSEQFEDENRPNWIVVRKLTEGLPDCLFRLKFADPLPAPSSMTPKTPKFATPRFVMACKRAPKAAVDLCGLEDLLKDEDELVEQLASKLVEIEQKEHVLELEETELHPEDENIFTEGLRYFKLVNEVLEEQETADEFTDVDCYVIKWLYRVEKTGIRKLDGTPGLQKETGRQRTAYFYWFGKNTSRTSRGACALALRKFDKDRREHVLMEQGNEVPLFLHLFEGKLVMSSHQMKDRSKRVYLVHGSANNYFYAEEIDSDDVALRPQGTYIVTDKDTKQVSLWKGKLANKHVVAGAHRLAEKLAVLRGLTLASEFGEKWRTEEPFDWRHAPKMYRLFDTEGELVQSVQYSKTANFTHRQRDLKGTMMLDQDSCLWIWTDALISTFQLQTASRYWRTKNRRDKPAHVLCKGKETSQFKALFPTWQEWKEDPAAPKRDDFIPQECRELSSLLDERTRPRTLEEVRGRMLPVGCDTKRLEKFLTDADFEQVFKMGRQDFYGLPKWKQTSLKKDAKLF